jgi:hypothetical protein
MTNHPAGGNDPKHTLIIVGDDGEYYKLEKSQWMSAATKLNAAEKGVVSQLTKWGAYLTYIPTDQWVAIGSICTVVNLAAILKNQP